MINSKKDLNEYLEEERNIYISKTFRGKIIQYIMREKEVYIWKYIKLLRKTEYYCNMKKSFYRNIMYTICRGMKNRVGLKLGIEIWENTFESGLIIYHCGGIVINGNSKIGKGCKIHANNCIGNNGISTKAPILGNNVDIGVGAKVIGDIYIADDIKIGAGAVVTKSFYEKGITIAGVPAVKIK